MPKEVEDFDVIGLTNAQLTAAGESEVDPVLLAEGFELIRKEKTVSHATAIKTHWRGMLWSMALSLALFMDGYDGAIVNSFYGLPSFVDRFGTKINGVQAISANYQTALSNIGLPGNLLGLFVTGYCQQKYGSRRTYMCGMALTTCLIFLFVFCKTINMLLAAEALAAFAWALFNTLTAAYAAEVCPIHLRGYAASFISFCWGGGQFIAAGIERAALVVPGDWGWRMPFMIQWAWPIPLFFVAYFAPESPYWLVRNNKPEEAKKVLTRVACPGYYDDKNIDAYIAYIKHCDDLERSEAAKGSFLEMFKGSNWRRTEVMMGVWAMQVYSGTAMTAYAVEFFEAAGLGTTAAFDLNLVVTAMNLVGCFCEFGLISRFGRRPLLITGMSCLAVSLFIIGLMGCIPATSASQNTIGAFAVVINLLYHASVGPLTYTIAAEVPASRLRARSVAFGRGFYACNYAFTSQLTPRMVSVTAWNWGAKTAFFWMGLNLVMTTWTIFRLPETGGFSYAELDLLFSNKVPARKFTKVKIHDEAQAGDKTLDGNIENVDEKKIDEEHVENPTVIA